MEEQERIDQDQPDDLELDQDDGEEVTGGAGGEGGYPGFAKVNKIEAG